MKQPPSAALILIGSIVVVVAPARADPMLDFIVGAFAAEESAPQKQAKLHFQRGAVDRLYTIERIMPDRLHMHMREQDREQELFLIRDRLYQRQPAGWTDSPAPPRLSTPFSVVGLFQNRLENVAELAPISPDGLEQRVFEGSISWFAGRSNHQGQIRIFIDTATGLPRQMTFKGTCGTEPCSFDQTMSYDADLTIDAPVP